MPHTSFFARNQEHPSAGAETLQTGFSVLEAIVATAILAAALLPFVEFQSQSARAVAALERVESRIAAEQHALASVEPVMRDFANVRAAPSAFQLSNQREIATRVVRGGAGVPGRFEARLVELHLTPNAPNVNADLTSQAVAGEPVFIVIVTPTRPVDQF